MGLTLGRNRHSLRIKAEQVRRCFSGMRKEVAGVLRRRLLLLETL